MRRRHFLSNSLGTAGLLYGLGEALNPASSLVAQQLGTQSIGGESRYHRLAKALDRGAMQRGWLPTVNPAYHHAPDDVVEAFRDLKFGIRIHWGLYCMIGSDASWALAGANREFWDIYNVLYQFFNPTDFNPDEWMDLFRRGGIRFFTFTTKHHDGFSMWPAKTMQKSIKLTPKGFSHGEEHYETVAQNYSIMDGPYRKDIVGAVIEAGRRAGMGIGLYYSHVDWHDPAFAWDPFNQYYDPGFTPQSDPERWQTFINQEREQLTELMTHYGRINYVDFDIGWPKAAAGDIAEIAMMVRKLQPDIIMRNRGIGAYGDYYTPEREIPEGPSHRLWKVIYPCGEAFSYLPNDIYKPAEWILESLIGITAKGGNFEVGFGPMPNGTWPKETVERLNYVGEWLRVNGEAIYKTRPRKTVREGKNIWFTLSKDNRHEYAISIGWPGRTLNLQSVRAVDGSPVYMLGVSKPLECHQSGRGLQINIPQEVEANKPCKQAYAFKIEAESA
jgi:alpha-L-fucosidase